MIKQYDYKGHAYWVTVEPAFNALTNDVTYFAYVSDTPPGGLYYGTLARNPNGQTMVFGDQLSAFTNANAIKQAEIDAKL